MTGEPDDVDSMVEPVVPSRHHRLAGLLEAHPGDHGAVVTHRPAPDPHGARPVR